MIHLKKFNESSNDEYFTEISEQEWAKLWIEITQHGPNRSLTIEIPEREADIILDYLRKKKEEGKIKNIWHRPYTASWVKTIEANFVGGRTDILIELVEDEWYLVKFNDGMGLWRVDKFYKCDQLEGLLKFLDTKL
jgi:hypothetical protein